MSYYRNKSVCVVDNGLFCDLAMTLAKSFGRVLYCSPWVQAYPRLNQQMVGQGLPGVTRIDHIWPVIDDIDLFVFPDIFYGPLQVYLEKQGKRVWGGRLGENLEIFRGMAKRWQRDIGLETGSYRQVAGLTNLRSLLEEKEDQFVKADRIRGDMETFHAASYPMIEPRLDELQHALGAAADQPTFIVEEPVAPAIEVGYDGYVIDGNYPSTALYGVEVKDTAYLGQVVDFASLPSPIRQVNGKLSTLFRDWRYRGFFSSEIRVKNGVPYLIDPCCRMASPPGELYQVMIENLADVLWHGAVGEMIEPKFADRWGAQLVIRSGWAEENWQPVDFPLSVRDHIRLHFHTRIKSRDYVIPQPIQMAEIGAVVATGSTAEEAIRNVTKIAEKVEGYGIKFDYAALEEANTDMQKLKKAA